MSEFTKTMKAWRRMCNAFSKRYGDDCCQYCRLHQKGCGAIWEIQEGTFDTIAETVDAWVEENPEPVYPTWADYITKLMIHDVCTGKVFDPQTVLTYAMDEHIPADIAEKLGLRPKGENGDA